MSNYRLTVRINNARGLRAADFNGKSDPVVLLTVDGRVEPPKRSKTINANLNPVWNEELVLLGVNENDRISLKICDVDKSFMGKESFTDIGELFIGMNEILNKVTTSLANDCYYPLGGQKATGDISIGFSLDPRPVSSASAIAASASSDKAIETQVANPIATSIATGDGVYSPLFSIGQKQFVCPPPTTLALSAGSTSFKTGCDLQIYYPNQAPGKQTDLPDVVAGSFLAVTVSLKVYDESIDVRSLSMLFQGSKRTWTYVGIDKTVKQVIVRDNRVLVAFNPSSGCEYTRFYRGVHVFPLQVWVPEGCPSSMQKAPQTNPYLRIRYKLVYTLDLVVGQDALVKHYPTVYNASDLNLSGDDVAAGPSVTVTKSPMGAGGPITATVSANRMGYAQWEDILLTMNVDNQANRKIKYVDIQLLMIPTEQKSRITSLTGTSMHSWRRLLFPYAFAKTNVRNTLVVPLSEIRTLLPQSFRDGLTKCEIEYQLVVTLDVPLATDVTVRLPIRILVTSPLRNVRMIDPILMIPTGNAMQWSVIQVTNWIRYAHSQAWLADQFDRFGLSGSDLLMISPEAMANFVYAVISNPPQEGMSVDKNLVVRAILQLYRRFTLCIRLLNALSLHELIPVFNSEGIQADDLYSLTDLMLSPKIAIGPRVRILKAIEELKLAGVAGETMLMNTGCMPPKSV